MSRHQRLEQASRRVFDEIKHSLESGCAPVIWIRHLALGSRRKIQEQMELAALRCIGLLAQQIQVIAVHCQNEVEAFEVGHADAASTDVGERDAALRGRGLRASIRRFTDVVRMRASRIYIDPIHKPTFGDQVSKDALSSGRSANVAHTDE